MNKTGDQYKSDASSSWPFALPVDGWFQLCPRGEFAGKDELSGEAVVQVIDQESIDAMLQDYRRKSAAENFVGLLIDYDHFSENTDKPSIAAGWITELQEREDGLWFRARWSAEGEANLKSGCYRNISPSMRGVFIEDTNDRVRPMILDRAGLTNDPRFKNMRPLSNRGGGESSPKSPEGMETKPMKRLLAALGLAGDASEDSGIEAATKLKSRATAGDTATTDLATMKNRATTAETELATSKASGLKAEADTFCETHKAVIRNREVIHAQYLKDPDGTKSLVEGLNVPAGKEEVISLRNRGKSATGKESAGSSNAQQFEGKVQEFKSQNRCSYDQAFDATTRAHPELLRPLSED